MSKTIAYHVVIEPSGLGDGVFTAEIPALAIMTEGVGRGAALRAARRAILGYIRVARDYGHTVPPPDSVIVDVPAPNEPKRAAFRARPKPRPSKKRTAAGTPGRGRRPAKKAAR